MKTSYDIIIIGGGPAGLAAAISAKESGADVLIVEREASPGGILKQCIHDGFGLTRYGEKLTGPEYAHRDLEQVRELGIDTACSTFVLDVARITGDDAVGNRQGKDPSHGFRLTVTGRNGVHVLHAKALVLAMGCRERTAKQVFIHGDRPSGVFTAGCAQSFVNLHGKLPAKRAVILGSGDIGLIMARRLTLEGAEVLGVYEAKSRPSGLARNIAQCLEDFDIPLHLSMTVTRTLGKDRLEAVEIAQVDEQMRPVKGMEELIPCDTLILSVGLIPENEISEKIGVEICPKTKGPLVDQNLHTMTDGVFAAGNCLSVNDLVDYVSENGFTAGSAAAEYVKAAGKKAEEGTSDAKGHAQHPDGGRSLVRIIPGDGIASCVPQYIDTASAPGNITLYLRSDNDYRDKTVILEHGEKIIYRKSFRAIHQAEAMRLEIGGNDWKNDWKVRLV